MERRGLHLSQDKDKLGGNLHVLMKPLLFVTCEVCVAKRRKYWLMMKDFANDLGI
jgi:hypothetical protein